MKEDNILYIGKLFANICHNVALKCVAGGALVVAEFFIDGVLAKSMIALFCLIMFDWITGVAAAKKTGHTIKSSKIVRTPVKLAIYFMLITCARIAEFSLPEFVSFLDETVLAFLVLTEFISILENTGRLGYAIPTKLLSKLVSLRDEK